jgi:glycosyltransferase involved in cell wall biosynthesis
VLSICLVSQEYPPETAHGGIGSQTYLKAHGLASLGHRVHVISRSKGGGAAQEHDDDGVHVVRIPGAEDRLSVQTTLGDWLTYSAAVAEAVAKLHARGPLDVIDFPEWGCEGFVHLLNRTKWNAIPAVVHLHGPLVMFAHALKWPEIDSEFYRTGTAMEGACLRLADRVFSSSRCSADWCAKHYELDRASIPVLHTGVDTELFSPRDVPRPIRPTIVFAGNVSTNKGVDVLARAAFRLAKEFPGLLVKLYGRGRGTIADELRAEAEGLGLAHALEFAGYVDRRELPNCLCAGDVFAAPSDYEGGPGFVYLEAMACALPVIASEGSGASEGIVPGVTGLLVPPRDVDALTDALRRLLGNRELRRTMGAAARHHVLQEADSRRCIRKMAGFYAEVAAGSAPSERQAASS